MQEDQFEFLELESNTVALFSLQSWFEVKQSQWF